MSFTFEAFAEGVNADLGGVIGNLVNRLLKFSTATFGAYVPEGGPSTTAEAELAARAEEIVDQCRENHLEIRLRKAAADTRALWALGNEYLTREAPWAVAKSDPARAARVLRSALALVGTAARVSAPIIPATATTVLGCVGLREETTWPTAPAEDIVAGRSGGPLSVPSILFPRIEPDRVATLKARYD